MCGGFSLRTVGSRWRRKGVSRDFGGFVGEIVALSTNGFNHLLDVRRRLLVKSLAVIREVAAFRLCFDRGPIADSKYANRRQMVNVTCLFGCSND